jgi:hypothetical protein
MIVSLQSKDRQPSHGHDEEVVHDSRSGLYVAPQAHDIGSFRAVTLGGGVPQRDDKNGKFHD